MHAQGLNANIMSLSGIAIAIGAMVDAAIVMIENAHKHLERDAGKKDHWQHHHRCVEGGRSGAVLFAADHHPFVPPRLHASGARGSSVQAPGLHEDLRDGSLSTAGDHDRAGVDGILYPG